MLCVFHTLAKNLKKKCIQLFCMIKMGNIFLKLVSNIAINWFFIFFIFYHRFNSSGKLIFIWLQQQLNFVETKSEYYKSIEEFKIFMNCKRTIHDLSTECRHACIMLQEVLKSKEHKFGNHWRMKIRNCMDVVNTSPV